VGGEAFHVPEMGVGDVIGGGIATKEAAAEGERWSEGGGDADDAVGGGGVVEDAAGGHFEGEAPGEEGPGGVDDGGVAAAVVF